MECIIDVDFNVCEDIKYIDTTIQLANEGHMLIVPVYLYNVSPCRKVVVGIQILVHGRLYAMKTCKVFTDGYPYSRKIDKFYVDEFNFLFTDVCVEDIDIKIMAHYVY